MYVNRPHTIRRIYDMNRNLQESFGVPKVLETHPKWSLVLGEKGWFDVERICLHLSDLTRAGYIYSLQGIPKGANHTLPETKFVLEN